MESERNETAGWGRRDDRPPAGAGELTGLTPAERETEAALAGLRPVPPAAGGRDAVLRLAFQAGRAAAEADAGRRGRPQLLAWRAAAAVLAVGLGLSLLARPEPQTVERVVVKYRDRPGPGDDPTVTQAVAGQTDQPFQPAGWPAAAPGRPLVPSAESDYLVVRDAVLHLGVPALPSAGGGQASVAAGAGPSAGDLLGGTPRRAPGGAGWVVDLSKIRDLFMPGERL